jgi:manganese oxidase
MLPYLLTIFITSLTTAVHAADVHYYLKAVDVTWDYAPTVKTNMQGGPLHVNNTIQKRTFYFRYADNSYSEQIPNLPTHGDLGPIIRACVGDRIIVHFWNTANRTVSVHAHGVQYDYSEDGNMIGAQPSSNLTLVWNVLSRSGPQNGESSVLWAYHSLISEADVYRGLIGPLVIYANQSAMDNRAQEVFVKSIIDVYPLEDSLDDSDTEENSTLEYFAINGMMYGNLPDIVIVEGKVVTWYLIAFGDEADTHAMHWHGNVVKTDNGIKDVVAIFPASFLQVEMIADSRGRWLYHCHVLEHFEKGMYVYYNVI